MYWLVNVLIYSIGFFITKPLKLCCMLLKHIDGWFLSITLICLVFNRHRNRLIHNIVEHTRQFIHSVNMSFRSVHCHRKSEKYTIDTSYKQGQFYRRDTTMADNRTIRLHLFNVPKDKHKFAIGYSYLLKHTWTPAPCN